MLVETADKDGNGMIDYKEFCDRFRLAANDKELQQQYRCARTSRRTAATPLSLPAPPEDIRTHTPHDAVSVVPAPHFSHLPPPS